MKKQVLIIIAAAGLAYNTQAQQLPLYNQYYAVPFLINPSLAGSTDFVNVSLIHKSMWKDIPGAPVTSALMAEGPIQEKNIGLGAVLFNDVTDMTQRLGFSTSYSYRLKIDENSRLLFGASIGIIDTKIDFTRAVVKDINDPLLQRNTIHKTVPDAGLGMTYMWKTLEIGLAAPQLLGNKVDLGSGPKTAYYVLARHYLVSAKYTFDINKQKGLRIYPLAVARYTQNAPIQYDGSVVLDWENRGWLAATYRSDYAVGINLGVKVNKSLRAGYAYELAVGSIASYSGGSHEIMLGYTFGKKEEKPAGDTLAFSKDRTRQDRLTDSMMLVLKKENETNKQQVEQLKQQLDSLKSKQGAGPGSGGNAPKGPQPEANSSPGNDSTGVLRNSIAGDFTDEDGKGVLPNFYVIVGAFKNKEGAAERKADYLKRGFSMSSVIYNDKKKLFYVSVISTASEDAAKRELSDAKYGTPDAWVFILK